MSDVVRGLNFASVGRAKALLDRLVKADPRPLSEEERYAFEDVLDTLADKHPKETMAWIQRNVVPYCPGVPEGADPEIDLEWG